MLNREPTRSPASSDDELFGVAEVVRMFATVFDLEEIDPDADFFAMGGDSLLGEMLIAEIERTVGVSLSISVLMEAPTPRALADEIVQASRRRSGSNLVKASAEGEGPTIFCIHGLDGESFFPHRLNQQLAQHRPLYGFRAFGLEPGEVPQTSVEAMAASYLAAATQAQPNGPYILLGHCAIGAMVAWEMVQMLNAAGKDVAGLILIDPAISEERAPFLHKSGLALELALTKGQRRVAEVAAKATDDPEATAQVRKELVKETTSAATGCYVPKPLACPTLFICNTSLEAGLFNPRFGYQRLLSNMEVVVINASHNDLFWSPLPFGLMTTKIRQFLDRIAPLAPAAGQS